MVSCLLFCMGVVVVVYFVCGVFFGVWRVFDCIYFMDFVCVVYFHSI